MGEVEGLKSANKWSKSSKFQVLEIIEEQQAQPKNELWWRAVAELLTTDK